MDGINTYVCVCPPDYTGEPPDARVRVAECRLWLVVRSKSTTFLASSKDSTSCPPLDKVLNPHNLVLCYEGLPRGPLSSSLSTLCHPSPHPLQITSSSPL